MSLTKIGQVLSCAPNAIIVLIDGLPIFEQNKEKLQVGRFLKIAQGNHDYTVATIRNVKGISMPSGAETPPAWQFQIECQAIGTLVDGQTFERGSLLLPVPTEPAYIADADTLDKLFATNAVHDFPLGSLSMNKDIPIKIDGNRFFSKHIAIVGSTGSGKSCTVARILQDAVGVNDCKNAHRDGQKNAHVVIFDVHDEYTAAFKLDKTEAFTLNRLDIDTMRLPYWLMNSEELESLFIESNEANSHNQVSQFKLAVILNKEKHNLGVANVTYDMPIYFSMKEVHNYIENLNREVIGRLPGEDRPKLADNTLVDDRKNFYFGQINTFIAQSTATATKATNGSFNGEFNRFSSRLETKLADRRLRFLLDPKRPDGTPHATKDFDTLIKQFIGYVNKSNITIKS